MNTYSSAPDLQILKKIPILRAQKIWKLHILIFELLKEKIRLLQITGASQRSPAQFKMPMCTNEYSAVLKQRPFPKPDENSAPSHPVPDTTYPTPEAPTLR